MQSRKTKQVSLETRPAVIVVTVVAMCVRIFCVHEGVSRSSCGIRRVGQYEVPVSGQLCNLGQTNLAAVVQPARKG